MNQPTINKDIEIEDLVRQYPFTVKYLSEKGIKCIACGEPIWGTLGEAAQEKGINDDELNKIILEMIDLAKRK